MDMVLLVGAFLAVLLAVVAYAFLARKQRVAVYHVGAVIGRKDLLGKKVLVYGFVKPVYGKAVKIVGFGGTIKGRSDVVPQSGCVLEGVLEADGFMVTRIVKDVPGNWILEWVNPPGNAPAKVNK